MAPQLPSGASRKIPPTGYRSCPRSHAVVPDPSLSGSRANIRVSHCEAFIQPTVVTPEQITCISCPASLTISHSSLNVSRECPGMNHVVLILYLSKSLRRRRTPTVPAKSPAFLPQFADPRAALYLTSRDIAGTIFALVGPQPTCYRINVHGDATESTCIISDRPVLENQLVLYAF